MASPLSLAGQEALGALAAALPSFRHVAGEEGGAGVCCVYAQSCLGINCSGAVEHVAAHEAEWRTFMAADAAENCIPACWQVEQDMPARDRFRGLLVVQALRHDRLAPCIAAFVASILGDVCLDQPELVCVHLKWR